MTLEISSHHIIELIKEDIKLTHLIYGLQDLGLEGSAELCNLSIPIFHLCNIDLVQDLTKVEQYYSLLNTTRGATLEDMAQGLEELAEECLGVLDG